MGMIHQRTHPNLDVRDCFGCRVSNLNYATGLWRTLAEKQKNLELDQYAKARKEGSQPMSSRLGEAALRESDTLGRAYNAANLSNTYHPEVAKELLGKRVGE